MSPFGGSLSYNENVMKDNEEKKIETYDDMPTTFEELWAAVQNDGDFYVTERGVLCGFSPNNDPLVYKDGVWIHIGRSGVDMTELLTAGAIRDLEAAKLAASDYFTPKESRQAEV